MFEHKNVLLVLVCGVNNDIFNELFQTGRLPNLQELSTQGAYIPKIVSLFPTVSLIGNMPFLMGISSADMGISGLRLFCRKTKTFKVYCGEDYFSFRSGLPTKPKTLFEKALNGHTLSINLLGARGASKILVLKATFLKYFLFNQASALLKDIVTMFLRYIDRNHMPTLSVLFFHAPGLIAHKNGCGKSYEDILISLDKQIGLLYHGLKQKGEWDRCIFVFSADHGISDSFHRYDVVKGLCTRTNLRVKSIPSIFSTFSNLLPLNNTRVIAGVSGNSFIQLYIRDTDTKGNLKDWESRTSIDTILNYPVDPDNRLNLVSILLSFPSVDLVIARESPNAVRIFSRYGESVSSCCGDRYMYQMRKGKDPLGWNILPQVKPLISNGLVSRDEWYEATIGTLYPDAIGQIHDAFQSALSGDILISAKEGWTPWKEPQKASHGGIQRSHLLVPLVIVGGNSEGIEKYQFRWTKDVYRFICDLL